MHSKILKYIISCFSNKSRHYSYCMFPEKECTCKSIKGITYDTSLINGGFIDSFSMVIILVFVEKEFNVKIPDRMAIPENFDSVDKIVSLINTVRNG